MKTRLKILFEKKIQRNLSIFITAGFPKKESLLEIIPLLENSDCDIIEIGIPFSDPLADGPVIQRSSNIALNNGMSLNLLLLQVKQLRLVTTKPIVLMGYLNSILKFGIQNFYARCAESGVDGVILPDLPLHEFKKDHEPFIKKYGLDFIFMITPSTENQRVLELAPHSSGFLYVVSSNSTTGTQNKTQIDLPGKITVLKNGGLKVPLMMGFGIKNTNDFEKACQHTNGAIIGSAFVALVKNSNDLKNDIISFILTIKSKSNDHSIKF